MCPIESNNVFTSHIITCEMAKKSSVLRLTLRRQFLTDLETRVVGSELHSTLEYVTLNQLISKINLEATDPSFSQIQNRTGPGKKIELEALTRGT